jgi:uncharacterized membrane protein
MSIAPLSSASFIIQIHAFCAIAALLLGLTTLFFTKGTTFHVLSGRIWAVLMIATSLSSFFISQSPIIGPFGFIHILSVVTLIGLSRAIYFARKGDFKAHGRAMMSLYFQALILAGLFTFMPGRIMHRVLFEGSRLETLVFAGVIGVTFISFIGIIWRRNMILTRR